VLVRWAERVTVRDIDAPIHPLSVALLAAYEGQQPAAY
jgi:hypothetical protein